MRYLSALIKILLVYSFAKYLADQILAGKTNFLLIIIVFFAGLFIFISLSWQQKFILFSLSVLFPFSFPGRIPIPLLYWFELIAPFLCFLLFLDILSKRKSLFSKQAYLFFFAILILVVWSIVNYTKTPVSGSVTFGAGYGKGGLRSYFIIFVGITTFLCSFWFFKYKKLNGNKLLLILLVTSLIIGNLHVLRLYKIITFDSAIIFLGTVTERVSGYKQFSSLPLRMIAGLGIPVMLSLFYRKKWNHFSSLILLNLILFAFMGGGRASFIAVCSSIAVYVFLVNRKYLFSTLLILLIISGLYVSFFPHVQLSETRFGRVVDLEGGFKEQTPGRYFTFLYMWEIFKKSPMFGKGIGMHRISAREEFFKKYPEAREKKYYNHIAGQLTTGGHGAYVSILMNFGIGGIFWLLVMVFGSMYYSYRIFRMSSKYQIDTELAIFHFVYLVMLSIGLIVGGGGYDNMRIWFLAGATAGIISRDAKEIAHEEKS
jgi:O-antigen ligase